DTDPALHKALKARKWADFARLYNGPDYKRNLYDVKLEHAYKQHTEAHKETT
ncbi:N-acetylmuramidase domain-containing protein, partial [Pseudomonas aeruginosa]